MIIAPVLIDTGPLVAILREQDQHHQVCVDQLRELRTPAFTCWPVLTETAYLLRDDPSAVEALLTACDGGDFEILPMSASDIPGIVEILHRYADQGFQLADAVLMHLAEREHITRVFTLDRRDFSVFRTSAGKALELLPAQWPRP